MPRSLAGTHIRSLTSQGHPYARFRRALDTGNPTIALSAAAELFIPGFAGSDHAADAIAAALGLLDQTGADGPEPWIPVGVGVHTGRSFVGTVGEGDARDFTALGDTVNTAARLTGLAGAGEILISTEAATADSLETAGLERRTLELRGREQSVDAWVARAQTWALEAVSEVGRARRTW